MVDLVKIRKKAKEKKDAEAAAAASDRSSPAETTPAPRKERVKQAPPAIVPPEAARAVPPAASTPVEVPKLAAFLATAGQRQVSGAQKKSEAAEELQELLTFVIAGENYAVGIERVVEIITPRSITRVPNSGESLVGILSLRGAIVTLIDVRRRLKHPPANASTAETRVIVVDQGGENVGFLVDRVLRVVKVADGAVEPHPVVHASEQDISVRGVFRQGTALTILLDLENLLSNGTGL